MEVAVFLISSRSKHRRSPTFAKSRHLAGRLDRFRTIRGGDLQKFASFLKKFFKRIFLGAPPDFPQKTEKMPLFFGHAAILRTPK
jgi:hypothetical protein